MVDWQPGGQEVEAAHPVFGADVFPPGGPALEQAAVAEQVDDVAVAAVFQQVDDGPLLAEAATGQFAIQHGAEFAFAEVVIPYEGGAGFRVHRFSSLAVVRLLLLEIIQFLPEKAPSRPLPNDAKNASFGGGERRLMVESVFLRNSSAPPPKFETPSDLGGGREGGLITSQNIPI